MRNPNNASSGFLKLWTVSVKKYPDSLLADARARMAVYGHSEVLAALAEFDKTDRKLSSESSCSAFMQLIQTMRKVSNANIAPIGEAELYLVLFGYRPDVC
jgi:hypothetical protein